MRVVVADGGDVRAGRLAEQLQLELVDRSRPPEDALLLAYAGAGLVLQEPGPAAAGPLLVEFRAGRGSALLRRATLSGRVSRVVDATAGLGQDAFAMAEAGAQVDLIERSPVVAALLADGLERARTAPGEAAIAGRLRLHVGEAAELLAAVPRPEVVHLDPMYPVTGREGGKGKEMRILRLLLGEGADADLLLEPARRVAIRRVAVKRPLRAPPLAGEKPSGSLKGTTVRYDLYPPWRQ